MYEGEDGRTGLGRGTRGLQNDNALTLNMVFVQLFLLCFYLEGRERDTDIEIFHQLVHAPKCP